MSYEGCTQFEDLGRGATASAATAALWRTHQETCAECRAQERADALLREVMRAVEPPTVENGLEGRVVARLLATPVTRGVAGAHLFLLLCGGFATAAGAWILAPPAPLLNPEVLRNLVLGGALLSPLILMGGLRRAVTRLLGAP